MTKPIIVVKMPCKLLYVIQVKGFLIKCSTSWPYLISEFLVAYITIVASDWPRTFLHPRCFCLAYKLLKAAHTNRILSIVAYSVSWFLFMRLIGKFACRILNVGECFLLGRFALNLILLSCNLLYLLTLLFSCEEFLLLKINLEDT